jgi:hypothetical protein
MFGRQNIIKEYEESQLQIETDLSPCSSQMEEKWKK